MPKLKVRPIVDFNKCEGKGPCVTACPHNVFELKVIEVELYKKLSTVGKIKTFVHGRTKAYVPDPDLCQSCGLCVNVCPEKAIKLKPIQMTMV